MRKKHYILSPVKFAVASITCIASAAIFVVQITLGEWATALLFFLVSVLFFAVSLLNGAQLTFDETGIQKWFFGICLRTVSWSEVREVGVISTRIFIKHTRHPGPRYIYFSPEQLDDNRRFRLALEWPPRRMLYFQYTKERMDAVQLLWSGTIAGGQGNDPDEDIFF